MATSLKGQLGVKSSALAPTSSKYTTQLLVLDHMTNHYKKISTAKAAIDNAPPKSMFSSQKMRDRKSRKIIEKYGSRPTSQISYAPDTREDDIYDETLWDEPEDDEERQVQEIMRTTLRVPVKALPPQDSAGVTAGSQSEPAELNVRMKPYSAMLRGVAQAVQSTTYLQRQRPLSSRSAVSLVSNASNLSHASNPLKVTYDGDVLNKHAHVFTEPHKPFTPRTLKSNRESHLKTKGNKYYMPPKKSYISIEDQGEGLSHGADKSKEAAPQAKPRKQGRRQEGKELTVTDTLTESMLMEMSLQSHAGLRGEGDRGDVPPLNISVDKDHQSWLKEQACKAQIRARNGISKSPSSQGAQEQSEIHGTSMGETDKLGNMDLLRFTRTGTLTKSFGIKSPTGRSLSQTEEEQKYVAFAQEVTQDIVNRGICSDRVLHRIFKSHVERKKGELDERRLRAIVTDLRRDLGVQYVSPERSQKQGQDQHIPEETKHEEKQKMNGDTTKITSLETTQNTFNFEGTTEVFSTIGSQVRGDNGEDLSMTMVLKQYQMDLTVQEAELEDSTGQDEVGSDHSKGFTEGSQQNCETGMDGDSAHSPEVKESDQVQGSKKNVQPGTLSPSVKPRLRRQNASAAKQPEVESDAVDDGEPSSSSAHKHGASHQASYRSTDEETREDEEDEDVEEEYDDDYDADEDDVHEAEAERNSDDDF